MSFEEPQRLVEAAGSRGKNIRRVVIPGVVGILDRFAEQVGDVAITLDQRQQMVVNSIDVGRIRFELAFLGDDLRGTKGCPAKLYGTLGNRIDMFVKIAAEPV